MLEKYSDTELLEELKKRREVKLPSIPITIIPFEIMKKMISDGWAENPKIGESDPRINRMWAYLGYPTFTDDQSYCACTLNTCLKLAGYKTSESIPVARSFETYGKQVSLPYNAKPGDIIIFRNRNSSWKGHVGFFVEYTNGKIAVAGGNQDNKMCTKFFSTGSDSNLIFSQVREITDDCKIGEPDYKTLKEWKLI